MGQKMMMKLWVGVAVLVASMQPALGLDMRQAELVVAIMEAHVEATGEGIYHGGAGDVLERDMEGDGFIAAAGFDHDGWASAYDAVMTGYIASIAQDEFDAAFEAPMARLEATTSLTAEQKAVIRADMEVHVAAAREARREGAAHAGVVQPLMGRLRAVIEGE